MATTPENPEFPGKSAWILSELHLQPVNWRKIAITLIDPHATFAALLVQTAETCLKWALQVVFSAVMHSEC
jgi:hypothetical protein